MEDIDLPVVQRQCANKSRALLVDSPHHLVQILRGFSLSLDVTCMLAASVGEAKDLMYSADLSCTDGDLFSSLGTVNTQ